PEHDLLSTTSELPVELLLISASTTRRTTFRSADHMCSTHFPRSPEIEYLDCARSKTTPHLPAPPLPAIRNSCKVEASVSGVISRMFLFQESPCLGTKTARPGSGLVWDNEFKRESFISAGHPIINVNTEKFFFQHYGLTERDLEKYLAAALSAGGDYADLY